MPKFEVFVDGVLSCTIEETDREDALSKAAEWNGISVVYADEAKASYLSGGGATCPFCKSDNIDADNVDPDPGTIAQDITCKNCGKRWRDWYKLVDYEELTED